MNKKTSLEIKYKEFINPDNVSTLVLIHGWNLGSETWVEFWEIISKNWINVIIPDLPGFWETKMNYEFNLDEYAKVITEFIDELNLWEIILFWHDVGGAISVKIANTNKLEISNLVLNNSIGIKKNNKNSIKNKIFNYFKKIFLRKKHSNPEKNILLKKTFQNIINEDLLKDIKKININTLLIWWEKDNFTPISDWYKFRNIIKKSKLCVLDNEFHDIHIQNPKRLIETFLKNI